MICVLYVLFWAAVIMLSNLFSGHLFITRHSAVEYGHWIVKMHSWQLHLVLMLSLIVSIIWKQQSELAEIPNVVPIYVCIWTLDSPMISRKTLTFSQLRASGGLRLQLRCRRFGVAVLCVDLSVITWQGTFRQCAQKITFVSSPPF